jgi:hypothetical protein
MNRNTVVVSAFVSCVLVGAPTLARADEPTPTRAPVAAAPTPALASVTLDAAPATATEWYGWQPLLIDLSSIALVAAGVARGGTTSEATSIAGASLFTLGAPIVHLAHGHSGRAAGSVALRTLVPAGGLATGLLLGAALSSPGTAQDPLSKVDNMFGGALLGGGAGVLAAMIVDDVVLSRDRAQRDAAPDLRPRFEPRIGASPGGATVGVGGTF